MEPEIIRNQMCKLFLQALFRCTVFGCIATSSLFSQTFLFDRFTAADGLPSNWITTIHQDSRGYLWVGGDGGLAVYDGVTFKAYGSREGLPVPLVWKITESRISPGTILIGSHTGGLNKYRNGKITVTPLSDDPVSNTVSQLYEDREGVIWCGTSKGLFRVHGDSVSLVPTGTDTGWVSIISELRDGTILFVVQRALYRYSPSKRIVERGKRSFEMFELTCVVEDDDGSLWFGTNRGEILHMQGDSLIARRQTPAGELYDATLDGDGNIWFASNGGLVRVPTKSSRYFEILHYTTENGLPENEIITCMTDREDNLWIGGRSTGLSKLAYRNIVRYRIEGLTPDLINRSAVADTNGHVFAISDRFLWEFWKDNHNAWHSFAHPLQHIVSGPTRPGQLIGGMSVDLAEDGQLWIGFTWGGLRSYQLTRRAGTHSVLTPVHTLRPGEHLPRVSSLGVMISEGDRLWYNTREGPLVEIDRRTLRVRNMFNIGPGPTGNTAQAILCDKNDTLWVGSFNDGMYQFAPDGDTYKLARRLTAGDGIASDRIRSIIQRRNGDIWIGTRFEGISIYRNGQFQTLTTKDGLLNNAVWKMAEDEQGRVWVGTSVGMQYTDPDGSILHTHLRLSGHQVGGIGFIPGKQTLWSVSAGELTFYEYASENRVRIPPLISISGLRINGLDRDLGGELVFNHDENFSVLRFNGLSFKDREGLQYRYRLLGLDTSWQEETNQRVVTFASLPSGSYTFEVVAVAANGTHSETPATVSFTILPPWYLSPWTIGLYVIFGSLSVFLYVRIRTRRLERRSIELERIVSERTAELLEHRNQLHDQAERLRELDVMKSHFFTNISHEFRTPLTVILGHLDRLVNDSPKSASKDYQIMERNAKRLLQLINQLLDLSKLEAGAMTLRATRTDIMSFSRRITESLTSYAEHKKITLTFNGTPVSAANGKPSIFIHIDRDKAEKVLYNLLANALKFTPHGGNVDVSLSSGVGEDRGHTQHVEITVTDTGPGIPEKHLAYVFDRFYQVEDYTNPGYEGTGVGLALVKELVELHHGKVGVHSVEGKGTTFTVRLPLGTAHLDEGEIIEEPDVSSLDELAPPELEPATEPGNETHYAAEEPQVLVVEDNSDLRKLIRDQLAFEFSILEAENGTTGLREAEEHIPDLVISDIMMPGMDGYEFCRALKSNEKTNHIPVILLTAKATTENKLEGLETGADDYLTKPFNPRELKLRVRNLIETRKKLREKFRSEMLLRPAEVAVPSAQKVFLERVSASIEKHLADEEFNVVALSADIGMSRAQLHRKLKALTNKAPNELIRSFRLQRAAELIGKEAGSLAEIAYQVGFSSQAYFTRCFVEEFKMTPTEYRKSHGMQQA
jgi:signal transduction histidine kinase/DNA-binding response OmpR family regulator/ligand-binding sensor domain-containing protein